MDLLSKANAVKENTPLIYEEGKNSVIDESKIIEKTASGVGAILIDDVSEVPHDVKVQLSSDTITDFSNVSLTVYGANMLDLNLFIIGRSFYWGGEYDTAIGYLPNNTRAGTTMIPLKSNTTYSIISNKVDEWYCDRAVLVLENGNGGKNLQIANVDKRKRIITFTTDENIVGIEIRICRVDGAELTDADVQACEVMLVRGDTLILSYMPYVSTIAPSPTSDGVASIKGISPTMNIMCDDNDINISANYHKSYGMQLEQDKFWEGYMQRYENANNAVFYGAGVCWDDDNFKPPRPLKAIGSHYMAFARTNVSSITEEMIDCSEGTDFNYFGYISRSLKSAIIDVCSATTINNVFLNSPAIESVTVKNIPATAQSQYFLKGCVALKDVRLSGTISLHNLELNSSAYLTKESIINVFSVLSDTSSGLTLVLPLMAVNNAFETSKGAADGSTSEEWLTLVATKSNWTVSLV